MSDVYMRVPLEATHVSCCNVDALSFQGTLGQEF